MDAVHSVHSIPTIHSIHSGGEGILPSCSGPTTTYRYILSTTTCSTCRWSTFPITCRFYHHLEILGGYRHLRFWNYLPPLPMGLCRLLGDTCLVFCLLPPAACVGLPPGTDLTVGSPLPGPWVLFVGVQISVSGCHRVVLPHLRLPFLFWELSYVRWVVRYRYRHSGVHRYCHHWVHLFCEPVLPRALPAWVYHRRRWAVLEVHRVLRVRSACRYRYYYCSPCSHHLHTPACRFLPAILRFLGLQIPRSTCLPLPAGGWRIPRYRYCLLGGCVTGRAPPACFWRPVHF